MILVLDQPVKEGGSFRRFYPLALQFERLIAFPVALTIRHIIDEKSPLHGMSEADLLKCDARILASINTDEVREHLAEQLKDWIDRFR